MSLPSPSSRLALLFALALSVSATAEAAAPFVPGTGVRVDRVGDDFEREDWFFDYQLPKSSKNIDKHVRYPKGKSGNSRWFEGTLRGCPDDIRRVPTPLGGLPGSHGALLIRTRQSGKPGSISGKRQQDDLFVSLAGRLGTKVSVASSPSIVARVYLPPLHEWEDRSGISFGLRADARTYITEHGKRKLEKYWPGIFIYFSSKTDAGTGRDSARFVLRAGTKGFDFVGPDITQTGWWTLGMSFTPDGMVHYFVRPGVDNLTAGDHVASRFPYGYRCQYLNNFFFNVSNREDGGWSTAWIIDDPELHIQHALDTADGRFRRVPPRQTNWYRLFE